MRERGQHEMTSSGCLNYDGIKADIFSAAATLFLLKMKFQPFRRAQPNDPYYKKLAFKGKKYFWKIYSSVQTSAIFKDIFEKMISHDPEDRPDSSEVLEHAFIDDPNLNSEEI
jgi:serine/threonine protein kinase